MAGFKVVTRQFPVSEPINWTLYGTDAEAFTKGELLVLTSGRLTKCGATTKPTHVAVADVAAGTDKIVPVIEITPDMEFEAEATATVAVAKIGTVVTLHTDGLKCTATASDGVFTITATDGAKAVRGKFV